MSKNRPRDNRAALLLTAPFLAVYGLLFIYPTLQLVATSLTDAQLTAPGDFVGLDNYAQLFRDFRFSRAVFNSLYFVLMTAIPSTLLGLALALITARLKGPLQSAVLAMFFLPYVLPVTTVGYIWSWLLGYPGGLLQGLIAVFAGHRVHVFNTVSWVLPTVAVVTVWWTTGFNVLLFLAGLKAIAPELADAARIDGAGRWAAFRAITWPLIWPITALVLTIQLIVQIKLFDLLYLYVGGGQVDATLVLLQYIYSLGFTRDRAGYAAAVAVAMFVIVACISVVQFTAMRVRSRA
jgi:multiple sugar transport system permease protein